MPPAQTQATQQAPPDDARLNTEAAAQVALSFCTVILAGNGNRSRVAGMAGLHQPVAPATEFKT